MATAKIERSKCSSVQQTIDYYMKLIPKPSIKKNKIFLMQFDRLFKSNTTSVHSMPLNLTKKSKVDRFLNPGTKSAFSTNLIKLSNSSPKPVNYKLFPLDIHPQITKRQINTLPKSINKKSSTQNLIKTPVVFWKSPQKQLKPFSKIRKFVIPSISVDSKNPENKDFQEKILQVDLSDSSMDAWVD